MGGKFMAAVSLALLVCLAGCASQPRKDYLEPETENAFLKNLGRASMVLSPIGMCSRIIVAEIRKDLAENNVTWGNLTGNRGKEGKVLTDKKTGEEYYVVQRIDVDKQNAETPNDGAEDGSAAVLAKSSYFIVDGDKEYDLGVAR